MHRCFVDGEVTVFVTGVENLLLRPFFLGLLEDIVEYLRFFVHAIGHHPHEGQLVL